MSLKMEWYYERDGQPVGPVAEETLREMIRNGALAPSCRVWCAAYGSEWKRIAEAPEFQAEVSSFPNADLHPDIPNREIMARARKALQGKWGLAIGACVLWYVANMGCQFLIQPFAMLSQFMAIPFITVMANSSDASGGVGLIIALALVACVIAILFCVILLVIMTLQGVLLYGQYQFHLNLARGTNPQITDLFAGFSKRFKPLAWAYLRMITFVWLWSLLFIIPGWVAWFSYSQMFYILKDHPELTAREAMERSKKMMYGYRFKLFCLYLRFIGWTFLCTLVGVLTCGMGFISFLWLMPYISVSMACFHDSVKSRA